MPNSFSNLNILHVTTFLQGGAGQIIAELACSQAGSGRKVTVAASKTGDADYGNYTQWLDRLVSAGVEVVLADSTFKRDVSLNIAAFRRIGDSLDCASLSLIHSHAAIPSLIALLLRSRAKGATPILQTMHGWGIRKDPSQASTDIILMNQLDLVITASDASRHVITTLGVRPELVEVVPNGVAPMVPVSDERRIDLLKQWRSKGLVVLVCAGTVGPRKNQRLLLQAMAHPLAPRNIACAIIGEGEEVPSLEEMAKENGIGDRVHFFGYQPEGAQFIASADWLALPSRDEGLPLSILEAYRTQVPVLGSDIPEITEVVVPEQTGLLFRSDDAESLASALVKAATMPENARVRMGAAAKRLWEEQYSLEKMLTRYDRLYRGLLSKGAKR
jgi:L-malate glycosyltransferase